MYFFCFNPSLKQSSKFSYDDDDMAGDHTILAHDPYCFVYETYFFFG